MLRAHVLPRLIWWIYRLWSWTWRYHVVQPEELQTWRTENRGIIYAHWHGDELAIVPQAGNFHIATMTSTSKDGSLMDFVLKKFGAATSRGSSTRGGARALIGLIRLMREGYCSTVAVDGPKGPLHQVKPGVFELAQKTEAPIMAVGVAISRPYIFQKSWNKARLPLPFSKIAIYFVTAVDAMEVKADPRSESLKAQLAERIIYASQQAAQVIADA